MYNTCKKDQMPDALTRQAAQARDSDVGSQSPGTRRSIDGDTERRIEQTPLCLHIPVLFLLCPLGFSTCIWQPGSLAPPPYLCTTHHLQQPSLSRSLPQRLRYSAPRSGQSVRQLHRERKAFQLTHPTHMTACMSGCLGETIIVEVLC